MDFDGVVVESVELKNRAFGELFRDTHPDKVDDVVAFQLANVGASRYEKFPRIYVEVFRESFPDGAMETLDEKLSKLVFEGVATCPFVRGAEEFVRSRSERQALFVASATPQDEVRALVERRGLTAYFQEVFGAPLSKADAVRAVLERGFAGEDVLFVGDADNDLRAAQEVGVRFIGRVPTRESSPFPASTTIVADLVELDRLVG